MRVKGIVELVTPELIEGWAIVFDEKDNIIVQPEVELKVNGEVVSKTFAVRKTKHISLQTTNCGFKFLTKDLYNYIGEKDELTVTVCGENIPFYIYGLSYKPQTNGNYNVKDLISKLEEGYTFDINGEFKLSLKKNRKFRHNIISLYQKLNKYFEEKLSYQLYACYGTLLGVARESDFISNDGNFDCSYLSRQSKKEDVVNEFKSIAKTLIKEGYSIGIKETHIEVSENNSDLSINIFCSWINEKSQFMLSFCYLGDEIVYGEKLFELQKSYISNEEIIIPKDYKDILGQIYGERWSIPDFGFEWNNKKIQSSFMSYNDINEIYWEGYYLNAKKQEPSTFCCLVNKFCEKKYLILDIGCGSARDSFEFAKQGHEVIGLDKSQQAISFANSIVTKDDLKYLEFYAVDISNEELFSERLRSFKEKAKSKNKNVLYYSRFFLHSIDENAEDKLLNLISKHLDKGDIFAAEFRTKEDEVRQKVYGKHYRRFINEQDLLKKLEEKCNMTKVLLFQKGTGFSVYKEEDPFLARIIVEKN